MAETFSTAGLTTADGRPLKSALAAAQRRATRRAFLLVLPLLLFVVVTFILPIGQMLQRSVYHDGFSATAPTLAAWFAAHPQQGYRVWKSMGETREHTGNKRRASSCSIPESHVEKLQRDHPDPNAIPLPSARG